MKQVPVRQALLVVAVVALVAVAGCSGLSGETTPTATETPTDNASENTTSTPEPAAQTETPDDSEGDFQTPDDSAGDDTETEASSDVETNETGADLDGAALNDATRTAIEDAGSYTFQSQLLSSTQSQRGQSTSELNTETQVDFDAEQGIRVTGQAISSSQGTQNSTSTVYTDDNTSYQERVTDQGTNYSTQEGEPTGFTGISPVNVTNFDQNLTNIIDAQVWEENTTTTVDGETVTQYDLLGVENASAITGGQSGATVSSIDGALYVNDDDVIRQVSIGYSVESDSGTSTTQIQLALSEIGSTTVEEPDWTSEAEDTDSS